MTNKKVISFRSALGFAGILGSLPIWATAAELNVYAPGESGRLFRAPLLRSKARPATPSSSRSARVGESRNR